MPDQKPWEKLSKKQKETFLRSALIDQNLRDQTPEEKIKEEVKRTGLNITDSVSDCVLRVRKIWAKAEADIAARKKEARVKVGLEAILEQSTR